MATTDDEKTTMQRDVPQAEDEMFTVSEGSTTDSEAVGEQPESDQTNGEQPESDQTNGEQPANSAQPSAFEQIRKNVTEDDDAPIGSLTLRKILGGDILSAQMVRSQIWLLLLIVLFITISVAFRYQCQQDILEIARLEKRLTDVKYKALSSSSQLTERCRESHVLEMLRQNKDSLLHISTQPPYIITVPEE